jgi:hypothetical protein
VTALATAQAGIDTFEGVLEPGRELAPVVNWAGVCAVSRAEVERKAAESAAAAAAAAAGGDGSGVSGDPAGGSGSGRGSAGGGGSGSAGGGGGGTIDGTSVSHKQAQVVAPQALPPQAAAAAAAAAAQAAAAAVAAQAEAAAVAAQAEAAAVAAQAEAAALPKAAKGTVPALFRGFAAAGVGGGHADGARKRPADEQPKPDPRPKGAKKNIVASLWQAYAAKQNAAAVGGGATGSGVGSSSGRAGGGHVDANHYNGRNVSDEQALETALQRSMDQSALPTDDAMPAADDQT